MSLLVVGSVAFDALESPYGKVDRAVGGAATYFAVAASFFTHVNLVGIVGEDFTEVDAQIFHGRTINLDGLERACGKTFFWAGRYSQNLNERVTLATAHFQHVERPSRKYFDGVANCEVLCAECDGPTGS